MRSDVLQHFAKIGKFFRPMFLAGAVEVFDERSHAVKAGFVERLKNIERGEEKCAGAAGGVEDMTCTIARQKARSSSGPSQLSITSWANWRRLRLSLIRSLM